MRAVGLVLSALLAGCFTPTSKEVNGTTSGVCTVIDAFVGTSLERAICATAAEIVDMVAGALETRRAAGKLGASGECHIVPTTTTCLTDDELVVAIDATLAKRKLRR